MLYYINNIEPLYIMNINTILTVYMIVSIIFVIIGAVYQIKQINKL